MEYPSSEEMLAQITQSGLEATGLCYHAITQVFHHLTHHYPHAIIEKIVEVDRSLHQQAGPDSYGFLSSLNPFKLE